MVLPAKVNVATVPAATTEGLWLTPKARDKLWGRFESRARFNRNLSWIVLLVIGVLLSIGVRFVYEFADDIGKRERERNFLLGQQEATIKARDALATDRIGAVVKDMNASLANTLAWRRVDFQGQGTYFVDEKRGWVVGIMGRSFRRLTAVRFGPSRAAARRTISGRFISWTTGSVAGWWGIAGRSWSLRPINFQNLW